MRPISRREFVIGSLALVLAGCGGGGSGLGGGTSTVSGTLTLPSGVKPAEVTVVSPGDVTTPTSSGFSATVADVPGLVGAIHSSDKVIGLAVLDPQASGHTIDATSSAIALLFIALGGSLMASDGRKPLLDAIKAAPGAATFAGVIQAQQAGDPFAVDTANAAFQAALATAVTSVTGSIAQAQIREQAKPGQISNKDLQPQLLIQPSNLTDGITVVQTSPQLGFQVQNTKRRIASVYTYLVGHVDANGVTTQVAPQQIGAPLDIPMTSSLLNLKKGWADVNSDSVALGISGNDTKTLYELAYLCPVYGGFEPSYFSDPRYSGEKAKLQQALSDIHSAQTLSVLAGIIFDILGVAAVSTKIADLTAAISNLAPVSNGLVSLLVGAKQGRLATATIKLLQEILAEDILVTPRTIAAMQPLIARAEGQRAIDLATGRANTVVYRYLRVVLKAALTAGAIVLTADLLGVAKDTFDGNQGDLFTATVLKPSVGLNPSAAPYTPGDVVQVSAQVVGKTGPVLYHWKYAGTNLAVLSDGAQTANEFDSSSSSVSITTTPSTQGDLNLTCDVYDTTGGARNLLGSASAKFTQNSATGLKYSYVTFDDGTGSGSFWAIVTVPLDPNKSTQFTVDTTVDSKRLYAYREYVTGNSNAIDPTNPANWTSSNFTALGINDSFIYRDPNWHDLSYAVYGFQMGTQLVFAVAAAPYGTSDPNRQTLAQATAKVKSTLTHMSVTVTTQVGAQDPKVYKTT